MIDQALYVIASPIGNLQDLSERAKLLLSSVDWIAAEDTRHTKQLLNFFEIKKSLISLHEYSSEQKIQKLVEQIQSGQSGAYVTDAGTPAVSDPGADLVEAMHIAGIPVVPVPGASALTAVISVAGFSTKKLYFHAFLERAKKDIQKWCEEVHAQSGVHVFFESPKRVLTSLSVLAENFSTNKIVLGRELTKKFEEVKKCSVTEMLEHLSAKENIKGEFCFALEIINVEDSSNSLSISREELQMHLESLHKLSCSQKALVYVGKMLGYKRNEVYEMALNIEQKSKK